MEDTIQLTSDVITQPQTDYTELDIYDDELIEAWNLSSTICGNESFDTILSTASVYGALVISECVLATLIVLISVIATIKLERWRKNYRNQMLTQLSIARLADGIVHLYMFLQPQLTESTYGLLFTVHVYVDFVLILLIIFFIKHVYDSIIIVVVNVKKKDLYKVICFSWVISLPVSGMYAAAVIYNNVSSWTAYIIICCGLRWPLMFLGTLMYLRIMYKVVTDTIRYYAKSLTVTTFLLCLVINLYSLSEDITKLWSTHIYFPILHNTILGLILNMLVLFLYVILLLKTGNIISTSRLSSNPKYVNKVI